MIERLYSKTIKVIDIKEVNGQPWVNVEFVFEEASEPDPNPEAREYPYPFKRGWLPQFNEEGKENIEVWDNYKGC